MKKATNLYLRDILDNILKIEKYINPLTKENFYINEPLQDLAMRKLEIIGEATKHIPQEFRNKYPQLPWQDMAGLRDILIHQYDEVNLKRVWNIVTKDIPKLKEQLKDLPELSEK